MSSVHHKTAYEEVAIEKGERNKKQSKNAMVQSKFIYVAFAIVFAVILVQGIVLYFVLKPSSSTKQQSLALDKMINSACRKSTENIQNPFNNSVSLFGITVDTSPLISKIESTLANYDKSKLGRAIRFKPTDECLTGGSLPSQSGPDYKIFSSKCDGSPIQQWRKVQHNIQVGQTSNYPILGNSFDPCLACHYDVRSCDLLVFQCWNLKNNPTAHNFIVRIYPNQIDLVQSRVYFSIRDVLHFTQCIGLQYNDQYKSKVFHLQECTGSDDQSFYLENADLTEEIDDIRTRLSSYLSSMLLGTQQNCPNSS